VEGAIRLPSSNFLALRYRLKKVKPLSLAFGDEESADETRIVKNRLSLASE